MFAARIVWLQRVASLVLVSDMSGKLEDLQTGLADKGEDWLRKELASLKLGPLRVVAGELGLSRGGLKAAGKRMLSSGLLSIDLCLHSSFSTCLSISVCLLVYQSLLLLVTSSSNLTFPTCSSSLSGHPASSFQDHI